MERIVFMLFIKEANKPPVPTDVKYLPRTKENENRIPRIMGRMLFLPSEAISFFKEYPFLKKRKTLRCREAKSEKRKRSNLRGVRKRMR